MKILAIIKEKIYNQLIERDKIEKFWKFRDNANQNKGKLIKLYYRCKYNRYLRKHGAWIPLNCKIEHSTVFPHGIYGVFMSSGTSVGENAVIFQQVTIGSNTIKGSKNLGAPQIGSNAYIGAGAKIIGGIKIGNSVRIGANCVVIKSIPDNATVVLNSPRIIVRDEAGDNTFHSYETTINAM